MAKAKNVSEIVDGDVELVATGFVFTEGPIWHPDGFLVFSDPGDNRQYRITPGDMPILIRQGESPDGSTLDINGRLITCDQAGRKVVIVDPWNGNIETLVDNYQGKKMNMCNDIVGKSDGTLYFSDPEALLTDEQKEIGTSALYKVDTDRNLTMIADDVSSPNGVAFCPDESLLYAVDTRPDPHIKVYDVLTDGTLANSRRFAEMPYIKTLAPGSFTHAVSNLSRPAHEASGVPDGIKVDVEGRVYCTGTGGTLVWEADGRFLGVINTPELPANCGFGDSDNRTLYLCSRTSVYRVRMTTPGCPIPLRAGSRD
jgi:sugar lactone lactonase YvrE